jgi:hypothetical protein
MGLFDNLMSKIFAHASGAGATSSAAAAAATTTATTQPSQVAPPAASGGGNAATATQQVDVAAILNALAAKNAENLDWKHSIVDLMKLVGMDSSLSARKQLATELGYIGNQNDTASMNVWLHKQVLKKLADNGGKVPQELLK